MMGIAGEGVGSMFKTFRWLPGEHHDIRGQRSCMKVLGRTGNICICVYVTEYEYVCSMGL